MRLCAAGFTSSQRNPRYCESAVGRSILNRCHRFRGFVYQHAHFSADKKSIEVAVRPRKGSAAVCSRCHLPAPGYDQLAERRFEFIPLWGFLVFLLYTMRRVNCRRCGIVAVEEVPWGDGKRTLTKAYMLFLARWARRLSWKETAEAFRTSWDKVFDAVEHVVTFGLEHRVLGQIDAIGVDEIQYAKGPPSTVTLVMAPRTRRMERGGGHGRNAAGGFDKTGRAGTRWTATTGAAKN